MSKSLEEIYKKLNLKVRTYIKNDFVPKGKNSGCDIIQHGYCPIYEKYLKSFINKNINFCEIGILCGDKLVIFNEYFEKAKFFGYDINIDIIKEHQPPEFLDKINIKKVDSRNKLETNLINDKFDILIDDGDHRPHSIIKTFDNFYNKVNSGGLYFIEDVNRNRLITVGNHLKKKNIVYKYEINPINRGSGIIIIFK